MSDTTPRRIYLRVSEFEWRKFQRLKDNGIGAREIFEIISNQCLCEKCNKIEMVAFNKENGEPIIIPNKILTKRNR